MTTLSLDHVAVPVRDVAAARRFYEEVLGLPLAVAMSGDDWDGRAWILLFFDLADGRQVALSSFDGPARTAERGWPADARHYAFGADDLAPWRARLTAAGAAFWEEDHGAQRSLFLRDPDDTVIEITCPPTPKLARSASVEGRAAADRIAREWIARPSAKLNP